MKILDCQQGTPEWHAARAQCFCASDAPAMMGAGRYETRNDLLKRLATGTTPEHDDATLARFARGHEVEAFGRAYVEALIGEDLYPVTATDDSGRFLASFDGLTMDGKTGFECKLWNEDLAAALREGVVPPAYAWQLEHQILVGGLERVLFVVTDGHERTLMHEYRPVPGAADMLRSGWQQLESDLKAWTPAEAAPVVVAQVTRDLPAVAITVDGSIRLRHNLEDFGAQLQQFLDGINRAPTDDQGFADAEASVKVLERAEEALAAAESNALAQTASIDAMRRTVAQYRETCRTTRLALSKMVKERKDQIRGEIVRAGQAAWQEHIRALNARLGRALLTDATAPAAKFQEVIKGKRTLDSLRNAVDTELARLKIEGSALADRLQANLRTLGEAGHADLFADADRLVFKAPEDFAVLVRARITEWQAREDARLAAERERIRQEEAARLQREAEARAEAERKRIAAEEQASRPAPAAVAPPPVAAPAPVRPAPVAVAPNVVSIAPKPKRPTDEQIIAALAQHFRQHEMTVIGWLLEVDLESASRRAAQEFRV